MTFWSCRETSLLIARGEFEEASGLPRALAWLHLLYCRHCRRFRRQLRLLGFAVRLWAGALIEPARQEAFERRLIKDLSRE